MNAITRSLVEQELAAKANDIFQIGRHLLYPYISHFISVFSTKPKFPDILTVEAPENQIMSERA